ncbi:DUF551 domain-containing protein, partial [Escherichia coli]|nr:DUF551 domain-containing protein [Escherichia coli]EFJ1887172.1 DUF551 domain-containing protein [Escherichia coli]ELL3508747.1 DUF551 domain-containing protein [Escherichia coli]ELW4714707.1 DUF551 domain-containing protein [Escherichia coli]EMC1725672.1 DUF551 domain-containing protein [Escherichia coli]
RQWPEPKDGEPRLHIKEPGNSPVIPDGLSTVCAEAYQVVGVMADALGVFGDAAVQKVLDNLSQQKLVHRDVLPFSLPVTPDGWISCSELMPDKLIPVMVMYEDGEMWSAMWNGNRWDDGTEYPDPHSVTHWREMPAAPQQEVK